MTNDNVSKLLWALFLIGSVMRLDSTFNRAITVYEQREKANTLSNMHQFAIREGGEYCGFASSGKIVNGECK